MRERITQAVNVVRDDRRAGWAALGVGLGGIFAHPELLALLPGKWSAGVAIAGFILQAITKSPLGRR